MSDPILPFATWPETITQARIPANDNSLRNQILNGLVISESTDAQPGSPANGDIYIMTGAASGTQWATFDQYDLAIFMSGTWYAYAPVSGIVVNVAGTLKRWNGSSYVDAASGGSASNTVTALATSGAVTIDCSLGDYFTCALAGNVTSISFTNLPGSGKGATKMVRFTQDATARTVAWPASFKWAGGVTGAVSTASGAVDVLALTTFDNGSTWDATLAKAFA